MALGDIAFKHLALVIYSPPEIVDFTVDFYEHLVQMPLPIRMSTKLLNPFLQKYFPTVEFAEIKL